MKVPPEWTSGTFLCPNHSVFCMLVYVSLPRLLAQVLSESVTCAFSFQKVFRLSWISYLITKKLLVFTQVWKLGILFRH